MSNRNQPRRGQGHRAQSRGRSEKLLFEQALRGHDERERKPFDPFTDRKTLQLCRQVQRALMLALGGGCGDALLREISIDSVVPAGGGGHLLVRVIVPGKESIAEVLIRLNGRAPMLRAAISGSICRKRVPMLSFTPIAENWERQHD